MPFLRRLLGRNSGHGSDHHVGSIAPPEVPAAPLVNRLVSTLAQDEELLPVPVLAWSVRRLQAIFSQLQQAPNQQALEDAQAARMCFTRFWLSAPLDQLETLYAGPIGQAYRLMLSGVLPALPLNADDERWKAALSQKLLKAFGSHETTNLLLAVLPYYDLNAMRVADPLRQVPEWLQRDYAERCDPQLLDTLRQKAASRQPASPAGPALLAPSEAQPAPRLSNQTLPVLGELRGEAGMALIQNNEFLGRMSGLINLYAIDPGDAELKQELSGLRRQVAQVWLDVDTPQLEALYRTPFGQLTQNLIASGFCREPLPPEEDAARRQLGLIVSELSHARALNALVAALMYYPPSKVNVAGVERSLPPWLVQELTTLKNRSASS